MSKPLPRLGLALLGPLLAVGCVPKDRYDALLASAQQTSAQLTQCAHDMDEARANLTRSHEVIVRADTVASQQKHALDDAASKVQDLQVKLDNSIAADAELKKELERLGKNADALLADKGRLASALQDARDRLEELRKAQAAAAARAQQYRDVLAKFQRMIDSGELKVVLRNGRMVVQLENDVLFESGHTEIRPQGQRALAEVASILLTLPDRKFQVAGNTDNVPIHSDRFRSNWELSTARAVEVVRFLVAQGVHPESLSAAGYGEFDPVAPNDDPAGRSRNRRIEISLQPNIDELVSVPPS